MLLIRKICCLWQEVPKLYKARIEQAIDHLSSDGYRVLALAMDLNSEKTVSAGDLPELTFLGFVGIMDAIRPEVKRSVTAVKDAGMKVVMITGDHVKTATAIAKKVGIYNAGSEVLTGAQMNEMTDQQLADSLDKVSVFARVSPSDKMRIIEAYKRRKEVIAMTGDGINDALSLVSADLGVSMGLSGTEVAREASDLVLLDDKFGNIIEAAEEGRNIYWNIRKSVLYLLSTNVGELMVIVIAILIGMPLPLTAAQIIWLNLVTDTFLVAAIAVDPKEKGLLGETFRRPSKYLVDWMMGLRILLLGGIMTIVTLLLFNQYVGNGIEIVKATTIALTVLTIFQWYNIFNIRSHRETIFSKTIFNNKYLLYGLAITVALHLFAIYTPFMQKILHTTGLSLAEWGIMLLIGFSIVAIEEVRKWIYRGGKFNLVKFLES
jgi:Ca2+-transporting ATPase